ncbi:MAG: sensor histidine kinase [Paenibacillaceae bacterium]
MRSLRYNILMRISIVAIVSFLFSAGFTYYYYKTILVNQMLHDDETKLRQTARQLQYMADDIANFSFSLIISDSVQTFFRTYQQSDTFDKFLLIQDTNKYLRNNKGLRKEVVNFTLVLPDGTSFWSEGVTDRYSSEHLQQSWYQNYANSNQSIAFTEPHIMYRNGSTLAKFKAISFIVKVRDISSGLVIGELIVHLDYNNFESLLAFGAVDFDQFLWMNEGNQLLFEKKSLVQSQNATPSLTEIASQQPLDVDNVSVQGGYMLIDRYVGNDWKLVSFTSQHALLERSKFVIYLLAVFSLTSTILILILMMPAIFRITRPIMRLYHATNAVSNGNLSATVSITTGDELEKLGQGFNRMTHQLSIHLDDSIRYEQEKREMDMELLLSQINPHFVYNTLNAVIYLAQKQGNDDIVRMVGSFIRILQDAVNVGDGHELTTLRDDIGILKQYIIVQSYRYTDMFEVIWNIEEQALNCLIPRILIQPFVENAIFHGICPKDEKGTILISAAVNNGKLTIIIEDNGIGMEEDQIKSLWTPVEKRRNSGLRHIGLANTRKRLEHFFGDQSSITINSTPGVGTTITIELPEQIALIE